MDFFFEKANQHLLRCLQLLDALLIARYSCIITHTLFDSGAPIDYSMTLIAGSICA